MSSLVGVLGSVVAAFVILMAPVWAVWLDEGNGDSGAPGAVPAEWMGE